MTKKMSLDDMTRMAGFIGGGALGFGIADFVTGLDDSLNDFLDAVGGSTFDSVGDVIEQTPLSNKIGSVQKKLRRQASDHWGVVKKRHFAKIALMKVEQRIEPETLQKLMIITHGLAEEEYSRWFWSWYEEIETFLKKYGGNPSPQMFTPSEVTLRPRPSQTDMHPTTSDTTSDKKDEIPVVSFTDGPLMQWIKDHPMHIGLTLMGAVVGEQIAQHPEVTASLMNSLGDIVPDNIGVG
jgi:hypothetical protein